jgi:hypothetical protein
MFAAVPMQYTPSSNKLVNQLAALHTKISLVWYSAGTSSIVISK